MWGVIPHAHTMWKGTKCRTKSAKDGRVVRGGEPSQRQERRRAQCARRSGITSLCTSVARLYMTTKKFKQCCLKAFLLEFFLMSYSYNLAEVTPLDIGSVSVGLSHLWDIYPHYAQSGKTIMRSLGL